MPRSGPENTREALWDAMQRKETYATTGTRMRVRVFGGYDFEPQMPSRTACQTGYAKGVPMGGDLKPAPAGKAPTFLSPRMKDPDGANLDRVPGDQGLAGHADGKTHEKVYDVAWSGNRSPMPRRQGAGGRQYRQCGGSAYTNTIGATELVARLERSGFRFRR